MRYESLNGWQRRQYLDTVTGTHHRRIELLLLNRNSGRIVRDLSDDFLGGSVQGDADRMPVEVCMVDVIDEDEVLDWTNGRQRHYLLRVIDSRFVPELDEWVDAHVFTGPLWDYDRAGDVVSLTAQGMERLAMGSLRRVFHRPRKARATTVIRDLLHMAGARPVDRKVPGMKARLPESVTIGVKRGKDKKSTPRKDERRTVKILRATESEDTYWQTAHEIAEAVNRDLYADGSGRFILAPTPNRAQVSLRNDMLLAPPQEARPDDGETTNTWLVLGADPKGKPRVQVTVHLPKKHPASPEQMAWHGRPRHVTERIENKHLRTKKAARRVGVKRRDRAVKETYQYQVDALPVIPWLRPNGEVTAQTSRGRVAMRVRQWTLPLGPGPDPLTIGANRRRGWH